MSTASAPAAPTWDTPFEKGLPDDFDFTIVKSFFAYDAGYNGGQSLLLQWEGTTDDPDLATTHVWWPIGKGWASVDGGKTVVHESGKESKYYNESSAIANMIARCVNELGLKDILISRGGPLDAAVWEGLILHMKREEISFGKNLDPQVRLFPVAFVGLAGNGKAASAAPAAAKSNGKASGSSSGGQSAADKIAAAKAKAAAKSNGKGSLEEQVRSLAASHDDFDTFQAAALELDGVTDDDALMAQILESDSGIWPEVNAG